MSVFRLFAIVAKMPKSGELQSTKVVAPTIILSFERYSYVLLKRTYSFANFLHCMSK
jgi:hypothetical protein